MWFIPLYIRILINNLFDFWTKLYTKFYDAISHFLYPILWKLVIISIWKLSGSERVMVWIEWSSPILFKQQITNITVNWSWDWINMITVHILFQCNFRFWTIVSSSYDYLSLMKTCHQCDGWVTENIPTMLQSLHGYALTIGLYALSLQEIQLFFLFRIAFSFSSLKCKSMNYGIRNILN